MGAVWGVVLKIFRTLCAQYFHSPPIKNTFLRHWSWLSLNHLIFCIVFEQDKDAGLVYRRERHSRNLIEVLWNYHFAIATLCCHLDLSIVAKECLTRNQNLRSLNSNQNWILDFFSRIMFLSSRAFLSTFAFTRPLVISSHYWWFTLLLVN